VNAASLKLPAILPAWMPGLLPLIALGLAVLLVLVSAAAVRALRRPAGSFSQKPLLAVVGASSAAVRSLIPDRAGADGAVVTFEDGLLGSERWETRWTEQIRALRRSRRNRPLDGLVIVVPARQLAGGSRLTDAALVSLGQRLHRIVVIAQRLGGWRVPGWRVPGWRVPGWRVPVHLVISDGADLAGFAATAAALPQPVRQAPFGWAVPYGPDSVFERGWVREGIEALVSRLGTLQSVLMMQPRKAADAEGILLFPQALTTLADGLSVLLSSMLRPGRHAFMFRGFWLTGQDAVGRVSFAGRLFAERIFPAHVLGQPVRGATTRRERGLRIAQVAFAASLLLAVVGTWGAHRSARDIAPARLLVSGIGSLQQLMPAITGGRAATTAGLLQLMGDVKLNRLESWWAPLSFLTDATDDVVTAIRAGYEIAVLRTVHDRLTVAIPSLLGPRDVAGGDPGRLPHTLTQLAVYANQLQIYRDLPSHPRVENLASLLQFALAIPLPADFVADYQLYQAGLRSARERPLDMRRIRATVGDIVSTRFAEALRAAYPESPLSLAVQETTAAADQAAGLEGLRRLDSALHMIQAQAAGAEYGWLAGNTAAVPIAAAVGELASLAGGAAPIAPDLPARLQQQAASSLASTRLNLLAAMVFGNVPVLAVAHGQVALSPPLQAILPVLDGFLAQPLATATIGSAGAPLLWDIKGLRNLQSLTESYIMFAASALPGTLPRGFRDAVRAAAGERLDRLVQDALARARLQATEPSFAPSSNTAALSDEITRFGDAAPILTHLRGALVQAGRPSEAIALDQTLADQAARLLREVDALLTAADPYQLADRSLAFWTGAPPLAAAAFGAETLADLVASLPARRDYVEALSRDYAAPLVGYLQQNTELPTGPRAALLVRWQGIAATLERYHHSDPANSLSRLEQFIAADMDRISLANCSQTVAAVSTSTDWFAVQLQNIRRAVASRCAAPPRGTQVRLQR
jgi:type VI secretion system protein ImpL